MANKGCSHGACHPTVMVHGTAGCMAWMTVPFIDAISGFVGLACESDGVERADRLENIQVVWCARSTICCKPPYPWAGLTRYDIFKACEWNHNNMHHCRRFAGAYDDMHWLSGKNSGLFIVGDRVTWTFNYIISPSPSVKQRERERSSDILKIYPCISLYLHWYAGYAFLSCRVSGIRIRYS